MNCEAWLLSTLLILAIQKGYTGSIISECLPVNNPYYSKSIIKSGYLTVDTKNNSALFFTFQGKQNIKDESKLKDFPVLIYISGGPGVSSQFYDFGPTVLYNDSGKIIEKEQEITWNSLVNLMFIDQPIGTGGSIAASYDEMICNESQVSEHFYYALQQFYKLDFGKQFLDSKWQIFGISYAGKYIPNIAKKIIEENNIGKNKYINLIGLGIGNGWTDPVAMTMEQGNTGFNQGFLDFPEKMVIESMLIKVSLLCKMGGNDRLAVATELSQDIDDIIEEIVDIYDYRDDPAGEQPNETISEQYFNTPSIHEMQHLKQTFIDENEVVEMKFTYDQMINDYVTLEWVLNNSDINVLIQQGTDDVMVPNIGTIAMVEKMKQKANENNKMKNAEFEVWRLENQTIAGYYKKSGKLELRMVLKAGHNVVGSQPEVSFQLFEYFFNHTNPT